jgi:predicted TIM-barrel fold metal-dependent hydrolase
VDVTSIGSAVGEVRDDGEPLLPGFPIIDAHLHQWDPRSTPREATPLVRILGRWPDTMHAVARMGTSAATRDGVGRFDHVLAPYLPADYVSDVLPYAVEGVVHVEAGWHDRGAFGAVDETRWVARLPLDGTTGPRLLGIVAGADLTSRTAGAVIDAHREASPLVRGVRMIAAHHADPGVRNWARRSRLYTRPRFLDGFEQLAVRGLRFDAWVYSGQLPEVASLARRFPEVPVVVCHLGTPAGVYGGGVGRRTGHTVEERRAILSRWRDDLGEVAALPNAYAKVSGLMMPVLGHQEARQREHVSRQQLTTRAQPLLEHALDVFGPARLMFASNFPMDKVTARLPDIVAGFAAVVASRGEAAVRMVFRDTARAFYGIG